jgi:hypothetical protein
MINKQTTLDLNGPNISFTQQPQSVTIDRSGSANFTGIATATFPVQTPPNPATGTGSISYRWYESSFGALSDGSNSTLQATISGSGTTTLSISNATKTDLRFYVVADYVPSAYSQPSGAVVNVGTARSTGNATNGPTLSNTVTLTVRPIISVTQNPSSVEVAENDLANFYAQGVSNDGTPVSYRWQLNGTDLSDGGNISGSGTPNLRITSSNISDNTVRARISHPTASNSPIFTNSVNFKVSPARAILGIESYPPPQFSGGRANFRTYDLLNGPFRTKSIDENQIRTNQGSIEGNWDYAPGAILVVYAPERDIRVRITMAGGAGTRGRGGISALGGLSTFDYTFQRNVEYIFLLGHINITQGYGGGGTFLYRKSRLVAVVGGGGAGYGFLSSGATPTNGVGGPGGGINMAGGPGTGGLTSLGTEFRGSTPGGRYIPPGTFLQGRLPSGGIGGEISSCSNGTGVINASGVSACQDFPGLTQFRTVNNPNTPDPRSAFLSRGFKSGFPDAFRYNNGVNPARTNLNDDGGGGAEGGNQGEFYGGGGGGSGYSDGSINLINSVLGGNTDSAQRSFGFTFAPVGTADALRQGFIHIQAL